MLARGSVGAPSNRLCWCVSQGPAGVLGSAGRTSEMERPCHIASGHELPPWLVQGCGLGHLAQLCLSGCSSFAPLWRLSLEKAHTFGLEVLFQLLDHEASTNCLVCFCLRDVSLVLFISSVIYLY